MGQIFSATFAAVAVSAAQDIFELVAPTGSRVLVREVRLGQYTDFGDAAAEIVSIQIIRGYTTTGSGGSAVTSSALSGQSLGSASTATIAKNNTGLAANGTVQILVADSFNVQAGWWYRPPEDERIELSAGQRLVVRVTAPADAVTLNGSLVFEEVGNA